MGGTTGAREQAGMDYVAHVSVWNQVQSLAKQMQHDIVHAPNHKYIAHQLALLYVRACVSTARSGGLLWPRV